MDFLRISMQDINGAIGRLEYTHADDNIKSSAFCIGKKAELKILLPRYAGAISACAEIFTENLNYKCNTEFFYVSSYNEFYDCVIIPIDSHAIGTGLYFFRLTVNTVWGNVRGYKNKRALYLSASENGELFQLSIVDIDSKALAKYYGGIIYHIFVDRFYKAGDVPLRKDAILRYDWEGAVPEFPEYPGAYLENNTFFGGTLYGVIEKLDYLKSLGTTIIYLSPIFEAYSNHKYDTGDYMKVDDMFGGEKALVLLIKEAKKRGIEIILDGVFNHTGADSRYFNRFGKYNDVGAFQSSDSQYFEWYEFQKFPNKYTCWWGIEILPRINPDIKSCGDFIAGKNGVLEKYLNMGVAGFRLDVADELSDAFLRRIKAKLREINKEAILYGEVWEDASNKIAYGKRKEYYLGKELDGVMNYPLRTGILSFLKDRNSEPLRYALEEVLFNAPFETQNVLMNLLGTHDTERLITILAGESKAGKTNAELAEMRLSMAERAAGVQAVKMAYTILATLPGLPTVFYGDEVGLEGYSDPFNRRPYPWKGGNLDIREHYCLLGTIRSQNDIYKDGYFELLLLDDDLIVFSRRNENDCFITVVNNSFKEITVSFEQEAIGLLSGKVARSFTLPSCLSDIFKTTTNNNMYLDKNSGEPI